MGRRTGFAFWAFVAWLGVTAMWWALAFAPLPAPPAWLLRARSVCFGTLPNGLPDLWGWGGLIVSPLAMLGFLLAVWGRELGQQLAALARLRTGRWVLVALAAVPLIGGLAVGRRVAAAVGGTPAAAGGEVGRLPADYPRETAPAPPLALVDQHGRRLGLEELEGRPVLLTFAFAHCRTVCPVIVRSVREAAAELSEAGGASPAVVVVTLDPWRDTPSSLPTIATNWGLDRLPAAHVLSGEVVEVLAVLDAWRMPHERDPADGDVAHPPLVYVLDAEGALAYAFSAPPSGWLVEAVRRL